VVRRSGVANRQHFERVFLHYTFCPDNGSANNYFLWSNSYIGGPPSIGSGGIVEWGHIVAPNFVMAASVPPPFPSRRRVAVRLRLLGLIGVHGAKRFELSLIELPR